MLAFIIFALVTVIVSMIICFKKGKGRTAILGFLFFWPVVVIGAIRLAKPGSPIFEKYNDQTRALAMKRFPKEAAGILLLEQQTPGTPLQLSAATRES